MSKPIYDPNTDYSLKILEAEKNGDLQAAASLERLRNEKIDDMGLSYSKTYKYNDDPAATYTIPKSRYAGGFDSSGYDSMRQSAAAYYDSAYRQQEQLLQQQREQAQQQYDRAAQSQYVAYAQAQQALPQQLAAAGLTGTGYTETAAAQLAAAYQSALGRNESARQQAPLRYRRRPLRRRLAAGPGQGPGRPGHPGAAAVCRPAVSGRGPGPGQRPAAVLPVGIK